MRQFQTGAKVCFVGDSITAHGGWIAHIFEHYQTVCPEKKVKFFNSGISGGSATSAIRYLAENTLVYQPNEAVIMLGMNDINHGFYGREETPDVIKGKKDSIQHYHRKMRELCDLLIAKGIKLTFCTPTPYDGISGGETKNNGCMPVLEACSVFIKELAADYRAEVIDFNAPMKQLIAATLEDGISPIIRNDRVHPSDEIGHSVMARLFLCAQGFTDVAIPTPETIRSGEVILKMSEQNSERHIAERIVRNLWNAEWLILQQHADKSDEEKVAHIKELYETRTDMPPWFEALAIGFIANKLRQDDAMRVYMELTERMYPSY